MEAEEAELLLHTGDIAYPVSSDAALEELYFGTYRGLMARTPFYPCPGNHDYIDDLQPYLRWHAFPGGQETIAAHEGRYYRFEAKGVEFLALDSNDPLWEGKAMLDWLDARLAASRAFWRVVFFHHPPYTGGKHAEDQTCILAKERLAPRLERARVPLVLNGHDHNYQRSLAGDTTYLVTGGGGAWLYEAGTHERLQKSGNWHHYLRALVDGWRMRVEAVGLDGSVLDNVELAPEPTLRSAVNAAGFEARLAPGALASVFGYHLAALGKSGVKVSMDGEPLPLLGATGGQLNVLIPSGKTGRRVVKVETPNGMATMEIEVVRAAPALFRDAAGRPLMSGPANVGAKVKLYLTGSGGEKVRLKAGLKDLGVYTATPALGLAGVEELDVVLPVGWEGLRAEAAN